MSIPEEILNAYKLTYCKIQCIKGASSMLECQWIARKLAKVNGPTSNKFAQV